MLVTLPADITEFEFVNDLIMQMLLAVRHHLNGRSHLITGNTDTEIYEYGDVCCNCCNKYFFCIVTLTRLVKIQ